MENDYEQRLLPDGRFNVDMFLFYILGVENDYEQRLLPDGRFNVDGFLCLFDVSDIPQRLIEWQIDYTAQLLNNLVKTKKPVVLATTKNDEGKL